jgi:hypothetical protein
MEQQNSAEEFIAGLLANSSHKFNFLSDIEALVASSFKGRNAEILHEAAFTAKYIAGLKRVLQSGTDNPEVRNIAVIQADVASSLEKLISILRGISPDAQFEKKFLEQTRESFANLNGLIDDLSQLKAYFNLLRRVDIP